MSLSAFSLTDQVAVVTGGGQGIGKAIALGFAEAGAHIVVAERQENTMNVVADQIRVLGRKVLPVSIDVRDAKQADEMVRRAMEEFGKILFAFGICFTVMGIPLGLKVEHDGWKIAGAVGPVMMLIGGLLWWGF
jgi:NAD(P)-dependent dehydrogenase (short-subunit alcohol dehydrogenase family)